MSNKNKEKEEIKPKLVAFLKTQKKLCQTNGLLEGVGLPNSSHNRQLIRRAIGELAKDKDCGVHVIKGGNKRLHYWYGEKPLTPQPNKKEKPKKEEP